MTYAAKIAEVLTSQYLNASCAGEFKVRHVEGMLRLNVEAIDALDDIQFADAVVDACEAVFVAGPAVAETVAQSFGLFAK